MNRLVVFLAQGLGSGRLPKAPGTAGTLLGLPWFLLLLLPGNALVFAVANLAAFAAAVWLCGRAERILGQHDPGSIVLDEIVALPLSFVVLLVSLTQQLGHFPNATEFLRLTPGWTLPAGFALFRLFDIWKPWPVRQAQRFPGGWGVVADDLLAALWVAVVSLLAVK